MSSLHKQFKMNHDKETYGVAVTPAGNNEDGSTPTFILARLGPMNQKYAKCLEITTQPYKRQLELKTLSNDKSEELVMIVFVNSILLGWSNVQDENGKLIEFSAHNAIELFKQLPDLYFELQQQAQNASLYRIDESEAIAKN